VDSFITKEATVKAKIAIGCIGSDNNKIGTISASTKDSMM